MNDSFEKNGYIIVRNAVSKNAISVILNYYQYLYENDLLFKQKMDPGDTDSGNHLWKKCSNPYPELGKDYWYNESEWEVYEEYGDVMGKNLLNNEILRVVGDTLKEKILPTFVYYRLYTMYSYLSNHTDRDECEIAVTMNIGNLDNFVWPIYLMGFDGKEVEVKLSPGDILIYKGRELCHRRNVLTETNINHQIMFFYVYSDGKYSHLQGDAEFWENEEKNPWN